MESVLVSPAQRGLNTSGSLKISGLRPPYMVRALSMIKNAACCQGACPAAPLFELDFAIKNKDEAKFAEYYGHLTDACNACHQAALQTLVVIQDPKESMFPDQAFRPKQ